MPATERPREADRKRDENDLERDSLAAVAQKIEPTIDAAQLGAAGATMATAVDSTLLTTAQTGRQEEIPEPGARAALVLAKLEQDPSLNEGLTPEQPLAAGAAVAESGNLSAILSSAVENEATFTMKTERVVSANPGNSAASRPETSRLVPPQAITGQQQPAQTAAQDCVPAKTAGAAPQQGEAALSGARQAGAAADGFVAMAVGRSSLQSAPAASATAVPEAPAEQVPAASLAAVEVKPEGFSFQWDGAKVVMQDRTGQPQSGTGATEGAQNEVVATGEKVQAPAAGEPAPKQQPVRVETAQADAATVAEQDAQWPADKKEPQVAQRARSFAAAEKGALEQGGVTQNASADETSGIKPASATATPKFTPLQAGAQQQSGDAGKKGDSGQKAPDRGPEQLQAMGMGVQNPAAEQVAHPEAKPVHQKGGLHESVMAQVKDGVVTHDGKGNGQMSIRLNPGELGELKIQVRMEDNRLRVEVQADNRMVKDLLMNNLESLKEALSGKNFTMEGFDVSTGGGFNSPLPEERGSSRQQGNFRSGKSGGYAAQDEGRVNYLTADVNNLLDVRF